MEFRTRSHCAVKVVITILKEIHKQATSKELLELKQYSNVLLKSPDIYCIVVLHS